MGQHRNRQGQRVDFQFQNEGYCPIHHNYYSTVEEIEEGKEPECPTCKADKELHEADVARSTNVLEALRANPHITEVEWADGSPEQRSAPDPTPKGLVERTVERTPEPGLPRVNRVGRFLVYEVRNRKELYTLLANLPDHYDVYSPFVLAGVVQLIVEDHNQGHVYRTD